MKLLGLAIAGTTIGVGALDQDGPNAASMRVSISTPNGYVEVSIEELTAIVKQRVSHLIGSERAESPTGSVYVVTDNDFQNKLDLDRMILAEMHLMILKERILAHGA